MTPISFIDAHLHANSRSTSDFERLAVVGCRGVVAVAGSEGGFNSPQSVLDHFRRLARIDRPRLARLGLKFYLALGIHPAGIPKSSVNYLLEQLPDVLGKYAAAAIGEIGLQHGGQVEESVLAAQLAIAADLDLPVIIHTPRLNKKKALEDILEILADSSLTSERVLLDHLNGEVIELVLDKGYKMGLTIHPAKLSPVEAVDLISEYGSRDFILSTDLGANRSYLFGIAATISAMQDAKLAEADIRKVVHDNIVGLVGHLH